MRKIYCIGIILGIVATLSISGQSAKEFELALLKKYHGLIAKENVVLMRIPDAATKEWNALLMQIRQYVTKTSPDLMKYFDRLTAISNDILNVPKIMYGAAIAPAIINSTDKEKGVPRLDPKLINLTAIKSSVLENQAQRLEKIDVELQKVKKELNGKTLFKSASREVRSVLMALAETIEKLLNTINSHAATIITRLVYMPK